MSEIANNQLTPAAEQATTGNLAGAGNNYSGMTSAEIKELALKSMNKAEPATVPVATVPEDEIPDDLKSKSAGELAKELFNLRKLQGSQNNELGELRKFKKETDSLAEQMKEYHIDASAQKLIKSEIRGMSDEEKTGFYEKFSENPEEALLPIIQKSMRPFLTIQARQNNEAEIRRLKEEKKDTLVPYDEVEVNKIINSFNYDGRNELFDQYGSGAFETAYDIHFKRNVQSAVDKRLSETADRAKQETAEEESKKVRAFTEPQGIASIPKGGNRINDEEYLRTLSIKELAKLAGKPPDLY